MEMRSAVRTISLPKIEDPRGNLTFLEAPGILPFEISRVFWTYDVPGGQVRGGHAYKESEEVIIALSGSFDVVIKGEKGHTVHQLNRSYTALYVPPLNWRHLENFSTNAIALTLSSTAFSVEDYIRDVDEFEKLVNER